MKKQELIDQANAVRPEGAPPLTADNKGRHGPVIPGKVTKRRLEQLIHNGETHAGEALKAPTPHTTGQLLAQLNALRVKKGKSQLKRWSDSRDRLEKAINALTLDTSHVTPKKGPTRIADGAETNVFDTSLHKNKVHDAVMKMNAREERTKVAAQKKLAHTLAKAYGFTRANVLDYVTTKGVTESAEFNKEEFKKWIELRDQNGLKPRKDTKARLPNRVSEIDGVSPNDIAKALKKEPRAIRIILRRIEDKIPKGWRVAGVRWGFNKKHKADIIKLVGGKPKEQ